LNRLFGEVIGLAYVACVFSHLAMALNRFTAIVTPARNRTLFTPKNTNLMLFAIWSLATLETTLYAIQTESRVRGEIREEGSGIESRDPKIPGSRRNTSLDLLSYRALKKVTVNSSEQQKRTRREARLFLQVVTPKPQNNFLIFKKLFFINFSKFQALLQDSAFMIGLVTFMLVSTFMTTKWSIYLTTSFIWEMVHICDGLITIACNPELRAVVTRRQQAQKTQGNSAPKDVKTGLVTRHKISMKTVTTTAVVARKQCNW
uniref:G_PROTEIN_RECEP_F1_2 domain-containing protein n=1 Tax=Anisakis simplex TaxID=6269 RepID=A0A0M3KHT1_ANISI